MANDISKPSGRPVPTSAAEWKAKSKARPIKVPSGHTALVEQMDIQRMIHIGMVPESLVKLVESALSEGKEADAHLMSMDENTFRFIDNVIVKCVVAPKVFPAPKLDRNRKPDRLYVDEVDLDDKAFLFNYILGGVEDLGVWEEMAQQVRESFVAGSLGK